ncbi:hypothetical protein BLOT_001862 [Blomia tropicalis]|nr:hypothetical protein BLOT_001862 [Blomia tropicalis]
MESWNWQPTNCINNLKTCRSNDLPVVTLKWLKKISKEIARELMKIFPYQIPQDLGRLIVMKFILTSEVGNELNISFKKCCIIQSSLTEKFSSNGSTHKFLVECVKNKFKSRSKKISDCGLWPTKRLASKRKIVNSKCLEKLNANFNYEIKLIHVKEKHKALLSQTHNENINNKNSNTLIELVDSTEQIENSNEPCQDSAEQIENINVHLLRFELQEK